MHPAQTLERGAIRAGAGASTHLALGRPSSSIDRARELGKDTEGIPAEEREEFIDGALAQTIAAPGLAPFVTARAGLGGEAEMGITYTGRRVRADLRRAFALDPDWTLSVGAGVGGILPDPGSNPPRTSAGDAAPVDEGAIGRFDGGSVSGFSLDVPLLLGIEARPGVAWAWVGGRAGYERFSADLIFDFDSSTNPTVAPATGGRFWAGTVLGVAVGTRPVWAVFEVSGGYQRMTGEVELGSGVVATPRLDGMTLSPALAAVVSLD